MLFLKFSENWVSRNLSIVSNSVNFELEKKINVVLDYVEIFHKHPLLK